MSKHREPDPNERAAAIATAGNLLVTSGYEHLKAEDLPKYCQVIGPLAQIILAGSTRADSARVEQWRQALTEEAAKDDKSPLAWVDRLVEMIKDDEASRRSR